MRYLGGKGKIARYVVDVIQAHLCPGQVVWEPFCGGLNVTAELGRRGIDVIATDVSVPLMSLLCAVRDGWIPPMTLTREEYAIARTLPVTDPLHGFAAIPCSFGAKYWGGFAEPFVGGITYPAAIAARRALLRDVPQAALLVCVDFLSVEPFPIDAVIYCDPPYNGRTGYGIDFDHGAFVSRVIEWSRFCTVLVSEYEFPVGEVVFERERAAHLRGTETTHVERIYRLDPDVTQ